MLLRFFLCIFTRGSSHHFFSFCFYKILLKSLLPTIFLLFFLFVIKVKEYYFEWITFEAGDLWCQFANVQWWLFARSSIRFFTVNFLVLKLWNYVLKINNRKKNLFWIISSRQESLHSSVDFISHSKMTLNINVHFFFFYS